jgi:hypothetical protein
MDFTDKKQPQYDIKNPLKSSLEHTEAAMSNLKNFID